MIKSGISASLLVLAVVPIILLPILLFAFGQIIFGILVLIIYYILNFICLSWAFYWERTDIQAKITWTIVQLIAPGAGAYIYFVFARVPLKTINLLKESELLESEIVNNNVTNSKIELMEGGENAFPIIFDHLEKAEKYINIQFFIMNPGIIHSKLFNILERKVKEGVKVRVLFDSLGCSKWPQEDIDKWNKAGIEAVEFRKIRWLKASGGDNFRSHNKIIVIDGRYSFFGGLNIGDEYFNLSSKYGHWLDTHYLGTGEVTEQLDNLFAYQWHIETRKDISKENTEYFKEEPQFKSIEMLNDSPERSETLTYNKIMEQINKSNNTVKIISPYVAFPISFKQCVRNAIERGVQIEIITIGKADKKSAFYQSTFDTDTLTDLGVKIRRMNNLFIHTKMFIFDDERLIIGTTNLDYRSLFHHFEHNLLIEGSSESIKTYIDYYNKQKEHSSLITNTRMDWTIDRQLVYLVIRFFKGLF